VQCLKTALNHAWPQGRVGSNGFGDAFEFLGSKVLQFKQASEQPPRILSEDDRVRLSDALQTCCEVGCLADDATLLRLSRSDQVANHDEPGRDADTGLQRDSGPQCVHRCDQLQRRAHRPFGIVLVRLRIAEVHKHTIPHVLRYEPAKALHSPGDAFLIG
jgi:hypothetical protein